MEPTSTDRLLPFSTRCPSCGKVTHGKVRSWLCLEGGSPFPKKVSGLILHACEHCGANVGSIMKAANGKAQVLESGDGPRMSLQLMARVIEAKSASSGDGPPPARGPARGPIARLFTRFRR